MEPNLNQAVQQVKELAQDNGLWTPGDVIVVAVSGGPDSVALLHILSHIAREEKTSLKLVVAHVNHGFRPAESAGEADFVRHLALSYDWPFELAEFNVPLYMKEHGIGSQEAARKLRYEFLFRVAREYGARSVALAHHGDDQAETILMKLIRGSGLTGLGGMRLKREEKNVELIRPLLRMYKTDLVQICQESGLEFVTDSSNLINKYTRNAIRLDVLPFLGQYNGQLVPSLNRMAIIAESEDDFMNVAAEEQMKRLVSRDRSGALNLSCTSLAGLHVALQRRLIKLILTYLPLNTEETDFAKVEAVRHGALQEHPTTWRIDLGGGSICRREYDTLSFLAYQEAGNKGVFQCLVEVLPAVVPVPGTGRILHIRQLQRTRVPEALKPLSKDEALFDADELSCPLTVRTRLPGDTLRVAGLDGSKKVKDIFIDDKVPPSSRDKIPLVVDAAGRILWIPGIRRSDAAWVRADTETVIAMSWEAEDGNAGLVMGGDGYS
ncbi:tRNA(Ile)-lysidine synthetase [Paenibacillus yonginensis]|uniref:tRNA(Ile)-lysidine synthase n=1 Tax=Paenibacillus yonginensis TaxID=1462996 RepID=A0A1B1N4P9_9BACL|nr:tRNA lysidine(34) synthetase TilS [Paenibacillus yonginensis]ANS76365.1 tRNA(Ile)-lysidine synthetase [Paenibacillus yonginensis]